MSAKKIAALLILAVGSVLAWEFGIRPLLPNIQCPVCEGKGSITVKVPLPTGIGRAVSQEQVSNICYFCGGTGLVSRRTLNRSMNLQQMHQEPSASAPSAHTCPSCSGQGKIRVLCERCSGSGSVTKTTLENSSCPDCGGAGTSRSDSRRVECRKCRGRGSMVTSGKSCNRCDGSGRIEAVNRARCKYCNGTAQLSVLQKCHVCGGSGKPPIHSLIASCSNCAGSGYMQVKKTCNYCAGGSIDSRVYQTCPDCNGTGGSSLETRVCDLCFGAGYEGSAGEQTCDRCNGKGTTFIPFSRQESCTVCNGRGSISEQTCSACGGKGTL